MAFTFLKAMSREIVIKYSNSKIHKTRPEKRKENAIYLTHVFHQHRVTPYEMVNGFQDMG